MPFEFDPLGKYFFDDINESEASRCVISVSICLECQLDMGVVQRWFIQVERAVPILQKHNGPSPGHSSWDRPRSCLQSH